MRELNIEVDRSPTLLAFSPNASLRRLARHAPLTVGPATPVRDALLALEARRADAAVVVDVVSRVPLGIVTLRDVLRRIAIDGGDLDAPVASVMTGAPITLPADSTAHQASVIMVRRGFGHLVLIEADGSFCNLVSQADLYARPDAGCGDLAEGILAARDIAALRPLAAAIRANAAALLAARVGAEAVIQRITAFNDLLALQVVEMTAGHFDLPYVPWCWLVFGSEGRLEQTLATDQDNGLVFVAESAEEAAVLRARFLPFARAVNAALDACGFSLCQGGIMAGNAACCLSLAEWKAMFSGWLGEAQPQAVLNSTIFFDFRPLYGQDVLAVELRDWLRERAPTQAIFLRALVDSTLGWQSPFNWRGGFRYDRSSDHPHTIDLKKHGARPFVDAARIYALAQGVSDTNTAERLRSVAARIGMPGHEIAAQIDAYHHIQRLRLEHQATNPQADPNRIDPDRLHTLDRQILKESLKQAHALQQRLERNYVAV